MALHAKLERVNHSVDLSPATPYFICDSCRDVKKEAVGGKKRKTYRRRSIAEPPLNLIEHFILKHEATALLIVQTK